jgi:Mg2+/Co2+ transporter CorC
MMLYLVRRHHVDDDEDARQSRAVRTHTWLVRALSREQALAILFGAEPDNDDVVTVIELPPDGEPAILWEDEN